MNRNASVDASNQSEFNPVLKTALASLDINLDEELAFYRRSRSRQRVSTQPSSLPVKTNTLTNTSKVKNSNISDQKPNLHESQPEETTAQAITTEQSVPNTPNIIHRPNQEVGTNDLYDQTSTQSAPQDYLESSEQLLNSLKEVKKRQSVNWLSYLFTPLGIGSALLLIASGGLVLSVLIEPEFITQLGWSKETEQKSSADDKVSEQPLAVVPDLSQSELQDLQLEELPGLAGNSTPPSVLTSPSELNKSAASPEAIAPKLVAPSPSGNNLAQVLLPSLSPTPTQQPSPNAPSVDPDIAPAPSQSDYYYVVMEYTGNSSILQAKAVVPDAYVRSFQIGNQIQMGAFDSESDAQQLVLQLKQQGIKASVYRP